MKLRLICSLFALAAVAGCAGSYSGYKSKCACDFQKIEASDLEVV